MYWKRMPTKRFDGEKMYYEGRAILNGEEVKVAIKRVGFKWAVFLNGERSALPRYA